MASATPPEGDQPGVDLQTKGLEAISYAEADIDKANFIRSLPDPAPGDEPGIHGVRNLRDPVTGEIVQKVVPWIDLSSTQRGEFVLENYIPGIEVSAGRKVPAPNNPAYEFDDPTDPENLRFFNWGHDISPRVINGAFMDIEVRKEKEVAVIGVNLGGTIMMELKEQGLVPTGQIGSLFEKHLEKTFPDCACRSFVFPKAKITQGSEANYGIDSSQIEIDFIADVAIAMTCIWNELTEKERRSFAGFVVSMGTDTCVEVMTILKTMLGPDCPFSVVAVGAMKPIGVKGSDGKYNFKNAFRDLLTLRKRGLSVIGLRVEGGLYDPSKTRKISEKMNPSFQGEKLINSRTGETARTAKPDRFRKVSDEDFKKPYNKTRAFRGVDEVMTIKSSVSKDQFRLMREVRSSESQAILVETYASFTQAMKDLRAITNGAKGRPIFYVNQVLGGSIDQAYEVAHELKKHGIVPLAMTTETARAKLNLAIRLFGNDRQKIVDYMEGKTIEDLQEGTGYAVAETLESA
ncbi:MAG: hypothetical protein US89_C0005G0071 [Candidatus Peregrinibacteria bacterium GW2011_GWF2_38_29]|nr:MAG: hypothetical protein US89_C0005G0071 [Candidatus Peregrinibacteria bacterium GW2011_GWF2_38_29]HBB02658.1 hypothetical protein [Candidatus Peregrinibacteria bacterium]